MSDNRNIFEPLLLPFAKLPNLQTRVRSVLQSLPDEVQQDFLNDTRFAITIENYEPGKGSRLFMSPPGATGQGSRCVVLRPRLENANEAFAKYVIAHEFAHAFLHNGGWGDISDIEEAADALAASWGYDRPPRHVWATLWQKK